MKYNYLYLIAFLVFLMVVIKFILPILIYIIPLLLVVAVVRNYANKKSKQEEVYEYTSSSNTSYGDVIDVEYSVKEETL